MPRFFIILAVVLPLRCAFAQGTVTTSDKLPAASIELYSKDPPTTATPWQLPKPGDPHYDADQEALTRDTARTHVIHVFEHGVFTGYTTLTAGPLPTSLAQEQRSQFVPNSKLPADAVELSADEHPDKTEYYQKEPKHRPVNVPANCIAVRVFQGKTFVGWTYMPKDAVAALHQPDQT